VQHGVVWRVSLHLWTICPMYTIRPCLGEHRYHTVMISETSPSSLWSAIDRACVVVPISSCTPSASHSLATLVKLSKLHPRSQCRHYSSIYFLNPLNLSFALSSTSSSLHTANLSQSSTMCALASVKNSVGGIAATPSSLMQNQLSLKSRGRLATWGGKG